LPIKKGSVTTRDIDNYAKDKKNSFEGIDRSVLLRISVWKEGKAKSKEFLSITDVRKNMLDGARCARKFFKDYLDIKVFLDLPIIYDINADANAKLKGGAVQFDAPKGGKVINAETVDELRIELEKTSVPIIVRFRPFLVGSDFYILINLSGLIGILKKHNFSSKDARKALFLDGFWICCAMFLKDYLKDTGEMEDWEFDPPEYLADLPSIIALEMRSITGRLHDKGIIAAKREQLFHLTPGIEDLYTAVMKKYRTPQRACEFLKTLIHNFGTNMKASLLLANAEEPQDLIKYLDELGKLLGVE